MSQEDRRQGGNRYFGPWKYCSISDELWYLGYTHVSDISLVGKTKGDIDTIVRTVERKVTGNDLKDLKLALDRLLS